MVESMILIPQEMKRSAQLVQFFMMLPKYDLTLRASCLKQDGEIVSTKKARWQKCLWREEEIFSGLGAGGPPGALFICPEALH